jgi:hypothetical protein
MDWPVVRYKESDGQPDGICLYALCLEKIQNNPVLQTTWILSAFYLKWTRTVFLPHGLPTKKNIHAFMTKTKFVLQIF